MIADVGDTSRDEQPTARVLLVDDSPEFLAAARRFLASLRGVTVVADAPTGLEAIAAVATLNPNVVVMDFEMPGMTGAEATRAIKRAHAEVHVVIVTLHDSESHRAAARAAHADAFITKSRFFEDFPSVLADLCAGGDGDGRCAS